MIHGCWQLSAGHGRSWSDAEVDRALDGAADAGGPCVLDMADIYTGVEERVGSWLTRRPAGQRSVRIHTKFVPDLGALGRVDRPWVQASVDRSLRRLGVERLDLVQFHWWDFAVPGWIEAAGFLADLARGGKIGSVGVTNFDQERLRQLLDAGVPIVSNQVQWSVLDRRPERALADFCLSRGITLLCYGTLAGGLVSSRWHGEGRPAGGNRSVAKYLQVVDEIGGWEVLQGVLDALSLVAASCGLSFEEVAMSYVRHQPAVASVIIGLSRDPDRLRPRLVALDATQRQALEGAIGRTVPGNVYEAERALDGPHGRLMRYDLGGAPQ